MVQEKTASERWKTALTVICLLVLYPLGLVFMFVWMKWPMWVKVLVLLFGLVFFLVGVLGVLGTIVFIAINPAEQIRKANNVKRKADMVYIGNCLSKYYVQNSNYPETLLSVVPECLPSVPVDPKTGDDYNYRLAESGQNYMLCVVMEDASESGQVCRDRQGG